MAEFRIRNARILRNGKIDGPFPCVTVRGDDALPEGTATSSDRDADGGIIAPALFALWCDFREPARDDIYTFQEGFNALRSGGFGGALLESASNPVEDAVALASLRQHCTVADLDIRFLGSIAPGNGKDGLAGMLELASVGVVGFGDADRDSGDARHLRSVMEYASMTGKRVFLLPLVRSLAHNAIVHECSAADLIGMRGIPVEAETIAVFQALELAKLVGCPLHLKQLTSAAAVALVRSAKQQHLDVTCDVSVHHLAFDDRFLPDNLDSVYHVLPPLRSGADREALWAGLADGTIDAVSCAHKPVLDQDKLVDFEQSVAGMLSLETALPLLAKECHRLPGGLVELLDLLSVRAAKVAATVPRGWMLYRPDTVWTPGHETFGGRVSNSPCSGKPLQGKAELL